MVVVGGHWFKAFLLDTVIYISIGVMVYLDAPVAVSVRVYT